jgi:MFS family permease
VTERVVTATFVRVWFAILAFFVALGIALLAVPLYARDELGARDVAIGIAVGATSVTSLLFGPIGGRVADRRGRKVVMLAGAAVMVLSYGLLLLEPPLAGLAAIRLAAGAGEGAFFVGAVTTVADLAPSTRRGEALSLTTVASYGGLAAGPFLGDVLVGDGRFQLAWVVVVLCCLLAGALAATLPETRPASAEPAPAGLLPPRSVLAPGLVLMLGLLGFGGFAAFAALYAREIGVRPGLVFALFGAIVLVVRLVGRTLPDRLGGRTVAGAACVTIAVGLAVVAGWQTAVGLLVGTTIFAVGQSLMYPAITLLAIARTPERERSAAIGSVSAAVDAALALGAFALGAAAELVGYAGAFVVAAIAAAAGLLVLARLREGSEGGVDVGVGVVEVERGA